MPNREVVELRNRILGILIQNARERARVTRRECAVILGIDSERFELYEEGRKEISLPELELLTRFLEVPIHQFRSTHSLKDANQETRFPNPELFLPLRHRIVGARLRQARLDVNRTQQDLAEILECSSSTISDYEYGRRAIPIAELEVIARALNFPLDFFFDKDSEIGQWHHLQTQFERFKEMSPDLRDFVLRPINESYLELALKLSQMPAGALRAIAEGLLEITY